MKVLVIGDRGRYEKYRPPQLRFEDYHTVFLPRGTEDARLLAEGGDAGAILADAISPVGGSLIDAMSSLRLIHSEGVAYDKIDTTAAAARGIYVCNNKGFNAGAVAEQAILLMLALLRRLVPGDAAVRAGRQIEMKETAMVQGIQELGDCSVGLVGFGDIARATAARLRAFGSSVYYYTPSQKPHSLEQACHVSYLPLDALLAECDIISFHAPVGPATLGMANEAFFAQMKPTAFFINTARGEVVDNMALRNALIKGVIAGAGLDTVHPEPTAADNPVVDLPPAVRDRVVFSPHLGGITQGSFRRGHSTMWANVLKVKLGQKPDNVVNGL